MIRPYWCPGNYNVADFFSKLLERGLFTMHAHRFGMNFEETIVGKLTEVYQTVQVHLKEHLLANGALVDAGLAQTINTNTHVLKMSAGNW